MGEDLNFKTTIDAQNVIGQLKNINTQLLKTNNTLLANQTLMRRHTQVTKTSTGALGGQASQLKGLALRFVGYNLVLNQVMSAQQKLAQFVMDSVNAFREFQTRMAEVSTILDEGGASLESLASGVEVLSMKYGKATSDMSKGLYDIISAAFDSRDALNLLNTATKASIAGLSDVRTSVDIFTTVLNAYGMSVEEATHISDVLFQTVKRGKLQFSDLESALGFVVPIAAQAGIKFDELSAALTTATRQGLHIDMAARGLALAIQNIIDPSEGAKKAAMEYGIELNGLSLRIKGLFGWFSDLKGATDEYGKSIINEIIPNMRSLRVAMVLAGEEGVQGFADDLEYLQDVSGKTEEALKKMMDTSEFISNQIKQQLEDVKRDIGKDWDELVLNIQSAAIDIAKFIGGIFKDQRQISQADVLNFGGSDYIRGIMDNFKISDDDLENAKTYLKLMREQGMVAEYINSLPEKDRNYLQERDYQVSLKLLESMTERSMDLSESWNKVTGGIKSTQSELGDMETLLEEIEIDIGKITERIATPIEIKFGGDKVEILEGTLGQELKILETEKKLKDTQHDVTNGLRDANHAWLTNNEELKNAVNVVREHEDAIKKDREAVERMNIAMRELTIKTLEIQLRGMMRRRGLTRNEQKELKRLQIQQAKLRLENMKNTKNETTEMYDEYLEKKKFIEDYIADLEDEEFHYKYTLDNEIAELNTHINAERLLLDERKDAWADTNSEILSISTKLMDSLKTLYSDPELKSLITELSDIDPDKVIESLTQSINRATIRSGASPKPANEFVVTPTKETGVAARGVGKQYSFFQRGGLIPETGLIFAHKGEYVVPRGEEADSHNVTIQITNNNTISKDVDVDQISSKMAMAITQQLNDRRTGKSKYRMR